MVQDCTARGNPVHLVVKAIASRVKDGRPKLLAFPLTRQTIHDHLLMIWNDPSAPDRSVGGHLTGWIAALVENAPQTLRNILPQEPMTGLQGMEKKLSVERGERANGSSFPGPG